MSKKLTNKEIAKSSSTFKSHNDQIIHILQEYDLAIAELSTDITTLEASKKEYTDALALLQSKKDDLEAHKAEIGDWASNFDGLIGPFEARYTELKGSISGLYDVAKQKHEEGLKLLMDNFDYHPIFKHYGDTFTAVPFKPK